MLAEQRVDPPSSPGEVVPLRAFVTACFSRRRKQLVNAVLAAAGGTRPRVMEVLASLDLDPTARPETLEPAAFVRLLRRSRQL